jgi:DNA replication protein DnaC
MEAMASQTVCPKCGGAGFTIVERANISGAEPCACRAEGYASHREARAQIPPIYRDASFENFEAPSVEFDPGAALLRRVVSDVRVYAMRYPEVPRPGLLLVGEAGTGKTHLAVAVLRRLVQKGKECLYCNYQTLLNSIKAGYDPVSNSSDREAYRAALDAEVLLLDDLGAQSKVTEWVEDTINSIITYRCDHGKALIATTNLPDPDAGGAVTQRSALGTVEYRRTLADHIGVRARSRLFEMCTVIQMPLIPDYRVRKAKKP